MPDTYRFPKQTDVIHAPERGYLLDVREVCRRFGMDPDIRRHREWVMANVRPRIELGPRTIRWDSNEVEQFIEERRTA